MLKAVGESATLKFHNGVETAAGSILDAQDAVMNFLAAKGFPVPGVIAPKSGDLVRYICVCVEMRGSTATLGRCFFPRPTHP